MSKAVGILEVYGLTTAFVAADAACKAADVTLENLDKNKPYLMFMGLRNEESSKRADYKDEWKNIEETLYLSSIPGLVEDVNKIRKNEDWKSAKEYEPDEEW